MNKIIVAIFTVIAFSGVASAKDLIILKINNKDVKFNHKGHVKYNRNNCAACHPAVPQAEESGKVDYMFCRGCHDQSLVKAGIKLQPIRK
ncbi:MAG: cytochrome c3 family protein [Desulfuromonadaceae bacterium]|nr:cytochrome c3 family protein [Desulfuromonadaceae bacterium]MDD2848633.1 cytochrome c3 family protein [Desulfuromonadaceae bacterium]MDD4130864.1 cytochrome c3 family protein [Desulfuromonadaceae bacterium]